MKIFNEFLIANCSWASERAEITDTKIIGTNQWSLLTGVTTYF
jgi:hypothetical protein